MTAVNHWFVTVAFAALGGLALVYPSCFTRIRPYLKQMRTRGWAYDRIIAVALRREQLENVPRAYGYVLGVVCLAVAAASALTSVAPSLWYALFCLIAAAVFATVFTHLRNVQPRRIATLTARAPEQIIPRAWVAAALLVAALPLVDLAVSQLRWTALAVAASTIVIVATGWRATEMPALLMIVSLRNMFGGPAAEELERWQLLESA